MKSGLRRSAIASVLVLLAACGGSPSADPSPSRSEPHDALPASCAEWQALNVGERYDAIHEYLDGVKILSKVRTREQNSDGVAQAINEGCYSDPPVDPQRSADNITAGW